MIEKRRRRVRKGRREHLFITFPQIFLVILLLFSYFHLLSFSCFHILLFFHKGRARSARASRFFGVHYKGARERGSRKWKEQGQKEKKRRMRRMDLFAYNSPALFSFSFPSFLPHFPSFFFFPGRHCVGASGTPRGRLGIFRTQSRGEMRERRGGREEREKKGEGEGEGVERRESEWKEKE